MIQYKTGDMLINVNSGIILHSVNTLGAMGAGVAKGIRAKYPATYRSYSDRCIPTIHQARLGDILVTSELDGTLSIINAFCQSAVGFSGRYVSYDAVDTVFKKIYTQLDIDVSNINTVKFGAGLGGGNWNVIEQIILVHLPAEYTLTVWDFK